MPFPEFLAELARLAHFRGELTLGRTFDRARCEILALRDEVTRLRAEVAELRVNLDYWYAQAVGA
jgi:hypothetical protein